MQNLTTNFTTVRSESTESSKVFHVAFAINDAFAVGAGICIVSILENNPHIAFEFHVFTLSKLSRENAAKLESIREDYQTRISYHELLEHGFERFAGMRLLGKGSTYSLDTLSRLVMPELLAPVTDTFLYLDGDVVCDAKVDPYLALDLRGKVAAVACDGTSSNETRLGLEAGTYFNAGVMYINIREWMREDISRKAVDELENNKKIELLDQDALNVVLRGKVVFISEHYHCSFAFDKPDIGIVQGKIFIHYIGCLKPWHGEFSETVPFNRYKALSPWSGYRHSWDKANAQQHRVYGRYLLRHGRVFKGLRAFWKYMKLKRA